ncbi:MAG: sensor histidine kinase, partial [Flavobacterium sp.]
PEEEEIITKMDRTQLIRVITNLVKNAIQALEGKEIEPMVRVDVKRSNGFVCIEVTDNGKGILPEHQDKVFEPKFTTKTSGMGLGLGIIKNIVENYSGSITFESTAGSGTTFRVLLPLTE